MISIARISRRHCLSLYILTVIFSVGAENTAAAADDPKTVESVDLKRYMGTWYEIARLPFKRQEGCKGTTATYALRTDGRVDVRNACMRDGKLSVAEGVAKVVDTRTNARLKVTFFWPFWGDYWILDLDPEYASALVGTPSREYLWILSRTPTLPESRLAALLETAKIQGFDLAKLSHTSQTER